MSPKGRKRVSSAAPAEEPGAKRVADFLKKQGVSKAMHEAMKQTLGHPLAGLTEDCKQMMQAMVPWSVCVARDERHEVQVGAAKMIEEVVDRIRQKLRENLEVENASVTESDAKRAGLQSGVQAAETALTEASAVAEKHKIELNEASTSLLKRKQDFADAEGKAQKENSELEQSRSQKVELETVLEGSFKKLKDGDFEHGKADSLFEPVKALLAKLDLDESLVTALPSTLMKHDRGDFDKVVVGQFEDSLRTKISEIAKTLEGAATSAAATTAIVEAARADVDKAAAEQQEVASQFGAARKAHAKAAADVEAAKAHVTEYEPEYAKATATRDAQKAELEVFDTYNVVMFEMLRDRISKQAQDAKRAEDIADSSAEPKES